MSEVRFATASPEQMGIRTPLCTRAVTAR